MPVSTVNRNEQLLRTLTWRHVQAAFADLYAVDQVYAVHAMNLVVAMCRRRLYELRAAANKVEEKES